MKVIFFCSLKEGFLADQRKPETAGKRALMYNITDGTFLLKTKSYVKTRCDMNFRLYPFDTQTCMFRMTPAKYISQQVQAPMMFSWTSNEQN